jgi:hypothetical protein
MEWSMSKFEKAYALYQAHKKECKMTYDPYRTPRQCPECGRLIEEVALAMVEDEKEVKDE